jgi:two-component system sensor histidine kinase KdpD
MINDEIRIKSVERFLDMIKSSRRGKFKVYLGMAAGVGKTYRMLEEAHDLLKNNVDVCVGLVETHGRIETYKLLLGIPVIPRKAVYYKSKLLEEMDLESIIIRKPEVILVDELAHTNVPGSRNAKRWQDVQDLLEAGINVITTVNIQHIESINHEVEKITGSEIKERVPDSIIRYANEVVNVDLTISELITRLKEGKVYDKSKVNLALDNFFQEDKLLRLRELALKEVARQVGRKIEKEIVFESKDNNAILTCISSNSKSASKLIRYSSRLATSANVKWYVLYVQIPQESAELINPSDQRYLINNLKLATELEAEVTKLNSPDIAESIIEFAIKKRVGLIVIGRPKNSFFSTITKKNLLKNLLRFTENSDIDILIVSHHEQS